MLKIYQTPTVGKDFLSLIEKLYQKNYRIAILAKDRDHALLIDQELWIHKQISFLPHGCDAEEGGADNYNNPLDHPIWISTEKNNVNQADCLISSFYWDIDPELFKAFAQIICFATMDQDALICEKKNYTSQWWVHSGKVWRDKMLPGSFH